jgi:putative transposase
MPRLPRVDVGNELYHVINRANARLPIFFKEEDYKMFEDILEEGKDKYDMRILAYCLMPNHFHIVLYPNKDGDLQKFMQWVTLTHTQRWHTKNKTIGTGHLYQGRYKSFLIQGDKHLLSVVRYVERNPLRSGLVKKAENWNFSSLTRRISGNKNKMKLLAKWPIPEPKDYLIFVNTAINENEEISIRYSINRGKPFGDDVWSSSIIEKFKLEATTRKRGRQIKGT